jgi:hypothetical protein
MDGTDCFVKSVRRFIDRLAGEPRANGRVVLIHLLRREEDKFAKDMELLEAVHRWIEKCDGHIARQRASLEMASYFHHALIENNIQAMEEIRETLTCLRTTWQSDMDEAAKFAGRGLAASRLLSAPALAGLVHDRLGRPRRLMKL